MSTAVDREYGCVTCIFCDIVNGVLPARIVYEDGAALAFLDRNPATAGHTLVVPKRHRSDLFDATEAELALLVSVARRVGDATRRALDAPGVLLHQVSGAAAGQDVFHLHFHLIPRYEDDTVQPSWGSPPWKPSGRAEGDLDDVLARVRAVLGT